MTITITPIKPTDTNTLTFKTQVYKQSPDPINHSTPGVFYLGSVGYGQVYTPEIYHVSLTDREGIPREFNVQLVLARTLTYQGIRVKNSRVDGILATNLSNLTKLLDRAENIPGPMGDDFRFGTSDIVHIFEHLNLCESGEDIVSWVERETFHGELAETHAVLADYLTIFCKALTCNKKLEKLTLPLAYAHGVV